MVKGAFELIRSIASSSFYRTGKRVAGSGRGREKEFGGNRKARVVRPESDTAAIGGSATFLNAAISLPQDYELSGHFTSAGLRCMHTGSGTSTTPEGPRVRTVWFGFAA